MESSVLKDPRSNKIINKDDSVTNNDNELDALELSTGKEETERDPKSTIISSNNPELYEPVDGSSNEGPELSSEKPIV